MVDFESTLISYFLTKCFAFKIESYHFDYLFLYLKFIQRTFFLFCFVFLDNSTNVLLVYFLYVDTIWKYVIHLKIIALYLCIHTVLLNFIWYALNQTLHSFYWTDKNIWFDGEYLINFYQTKMKIFLLRKNHPVQRIGQFFIVFFPCFWSLKGLFLSRTNF